MRLFVFFATLAPLFAGTVNDLTTNSSNFSASDWQKSYVQVGSGGTAAPIGVTPAQSVDDIADPNYQVHMIQSSSPVYLNTGKKASSSASVSIFLRAGTLHQVVLVNRFSTGGKTGAITARFDLNTGMVMNTSSDCCAV